MTKNSIKVTKMQGCGNDFVIVDFDQFEKANMSMSDFAKKICDRNFGIGADGLIIPNIESSEDYDIAWYFFNSDGSSAQMCGNGMRCFARYCFDKGLVNKKQFAVKTLAGIIRPEILDDGNIKVNMGTPILVDEKIPFKGDRKITVLDKTFDITPVSMGNPHCVIFIDGIPIEFAKKYGPTIEKHQFFPEKTNTEFAKIISKSEIDLCVYERGCGITLACGTGACATVTAGILNNLTEQKVKINLPGGAVFVEWQGTKENPNKNIFLIGPAQYSFCADYML